MRRTLPPVEDLVAGIRAGNRSVLGQAITLVESARPDHQEQAQAIIAQLLMEAPATPVTLRVGITGAPGVGKSTFIEALGMQLVEGGAHLAVLAIDPSSAISRGSILGDKTRMERLSVAAGAFVRPSPAGDSLGGVARKTRETIRLVEAAGYTTVLIETVGIGQSELAVHRMTDVLLLLLLPGAGDELQGIKRGIVEMADLLAVNKADGVQREAALQAQRHYRNALHLLAPKPSGWTPQVLTCSAQDNQGIAATWQAVEAYYQLISQNGFYAENRRQQAQYWLRETLQAGLQDAFHQHVAAQALLSKLEPAVLAGHLSPLWLRSRYYRRLKNKRSHRACVR